MIDEKKLRSRILSALNVGLLAAAFDGVACGGSTESSGQLIQLNAVQCQNGPADIQCWAPHETHFNVGNTPPGMVVSTPAPVFDKNGCQVANQVADGCCNPPSAGPSFEDGQCCYAFCTGACCGRPLVVEGAARVAPVVMRGDWSDPFAGDDVVAGLTPEARAEVARQWLADAQMEHASIASFARFTLDLLAFGAPPDLVEGAQRAALDEVRHTRLCFGVANRYAATLEGPGALDLAGVRPSTTLTEAAVAALREGCIGETAAALLAGERARASEFPALRAVYERIASDEATHAELAFRFVAWALATGGEDVRNAISRELSALCCSAPRTNDSVSPKPDLRAHGRLPDHYIREIERRALSRVVVPCVVSLVAARSSASAAISPFACVPDLQAPCSFV